MSKTPIQSAITLLESERIESPQTDMDRLNNEIIGRLVIRLGALKGMERHFAEECFDQGGDHYFDPHKYYDFDTFYSKFEG